MTAVRRKALVLGGTTGLVGRALAEELAGAGWEVHKAGRADLDFKSPDASDRIKNLVDRAEPDCVFNAIGYTQVDKAEDEPETAVLLNRTLPAMLGRVLLSRPASLVHFSSDFVFDGKKDSPYRTDDPANPGSVYGATKRGGEEALLALELPRCLILRTAWLFGPHKKNFISTILELCRERKGIKVVHDQIGSPTYTIDLARHTLKLVEADASGIFHLVNSGEASWCELAGEAVKLAQVECAVTPVSSAQYPQKAKRPAYSVLDNSCVGQATGVTPRPWPQALQDYIFRVFPPEESA